jgi:6-phosphogluconolactonase (cycloisomerase 2 family)
MKVGGLKLPVATSTTQVLSLFQTNNRKYSTPGRNFNNKPGENLIIISNQADQIYKIRIFTKKTNEGNQNRE